MKFLTLAAALFLTSCAVAAPQSSAPAQSSAQITASAGDYSPEAIAAANTQFGVELYAQVMKDARAKNEPPGNLLISPASVSTAFGLAYAGATGETEAQIANVLHFPPNDEALDKTLGSLLLGMQTDRPDARLTVNNALWLDKGTVLEDDYQRRMNTYFASKNHRVDYKNNHNAARLKINDWVEEKTEDKIQDLLSKSDVTEDTRAVLINTIYMKADWSRQFPEGATRDREFYAPDSMKSVAMMSQQGRFLHRKGRGFSAINLPYGRSQDLTMTVFLPNSKTGLEAFEAKLSRQILEQTHQAFKNPEPKLVNVRLPKFKAKDTHKLGESLSTLGMKVPFTNAADFSRAVDASKQPDGYPLKLKDVIQKTFIEVDENGTEAAAATAISAIIVTSAPRKPPKVINFHANHPFFYTISHQESGMVLFMGRVVDPSPEP